MPSVDCRPAAPSVPNSTAAAPTESAARPPHTASPRPGASPAAGRSVLPSVFRLFCVFLSMFRPFLRVFDASVPWNRCVHTRGAVPKVPEVLQRVPWTVIDRCRPFSCLFTQCGDSVQPLTHTHPCNTPTDLLSFPFFFSVSFFVYFRKRFVLTHLPRLVSAAMGDVKARTSRSTAKTRRRVRRTVGRTTTLSGGARVATKATTCCRLTTGRLRSPWGCWTLWPQTPSPQPFLLWGPWCSCTRSQSW